MEVENQNAQMNLSWPLVNLPLGQIIYWSVQAIDTAHAGSPWSAEKNFKLLRWEAPITITPSSFTNLSVGDYNGNGVVDASELNGILSNYFSVSPWRQMTNAAGLGGTNVAFALTHSTAGAFSMEYTTNLVDWYFLGPATPNYLSPIPTRPLSRSVPTACVGRSKPGIVISPAVV
jgi:hypothetical protein